MKKLIILIVIFLTFSVAYAVEDGDIFMYTSDGLAWVTLEGDPCETKTINAQCEICLAPLHVKKDVDINTGYSTITATHIEWYSPSCDNYDPYNINSTLLVCSKCKKKYEEKIRASFICATENARDEMKAERRKHKKEAQVRKGDTLKKRLDALKKEFDKLTKENCDD